MQTEMAFLFALALGVVAALAQAPAGKTFDIYVIDVEGGNSTLFVAPSGDSTLIDTGSGGPNNRDGDRILDAIHDAGLNHIDNLISTHWQGIILAGWRMWRRGFPYTISSIMGRTSSRRTRAPMSS